MRRLISHAIGAGRVCAGWFGLYVAAGGALVLLIPPGRYTDAPGCYPHYTVAGLIGSNCSLPLVNMVWFLALGLPRVAIVRIALVAALVRGAVKNFPELHYLVDALPFVALSAPFVCLYYLSFRYWRTRDRRIAVLIPLLIGAEALFLGFQE